MNIARPLPRRVSPAEIGPSLREGWKTLRAVGTPAYLLGGLFAFIGTLLIWGLQVAGLAPMTLPVVGGFLLVGPVSAAGFSASRRRRAAVAVPACVTCCRVSGALRARSG